MSLKIKHALLTFLLLISVIFLTVGLVLMTPFSSISHEVSPPVKSQRHLELEEKEFLTKDDMSQLNQEISLFKQRWDEKAAKEKISPAAGLVVVIERAQVLILILMILFLLVRKVRTILDWFAISAALVLITFLLPILTVNMFYLGLVISGVLVFIKLR